eukprot:COSAG02_NODE_13663_length_1365_cov_2.498420_2_plen_217_part_00
MTPVCNPPRPRLVLLALGLALLLSMLAPAAATAAAAAARPVQGQGQGQLEWTHSVTGERIVSPWPTNGYDTLPTLWFSANVSGPNSLAELQLLSKYDVAIVSWGQEMPGGSGKITRDSEVAQAAAAHAARQYLDSVGNNSTVLGVYRQIQIALGLFNVSHVAALDPEKRSFWLHQLDNASNICGMEPLQGDKPSQWGTYDPFWYYAACTLGDMSNC